MNLKRAIRALMEKDKNFLEAEKEDFYTVVQSLSDKYDVPKEELLEAWKDICKRGFVVYSKGQCRGIYYHKVRSYFL